MPANEEPNAPTIAEQYGADYRGSVSGQIGRILLLVATFAAGIFIGPLRHKRPASKP